MKIHEHQAKELFSAYNIPVPPGKATADPEKARDIAEEIGLPIVVKAQVHAGGRGKAGGIKLVNSPDEAKEVATKLLGNPLVTHQTGAKGTIVKEVLIEKATDIANELYIGLTVDRSRNRLAIMASSYGGVDIEETANKHPEAISKEWVDPAIGLRPFQAYRLALQLKLDKKETRQVATLIRALYLLATKNDCSLAEINPLVVTSGGEVVALDAKLNFDDSALFRHEDIAKLRDTSETPPLELEAREYGLNYIKLDGNVGCLVNGAGLAMATMDLIMLAGASPANFLDVGGGADEKMIENAFRILVNDPDVQAVFINIFGGILRCDVLAQGIIGAASEVELNLPVVIRLEGTNVDKARKLLQESDLQFATATDLNEASELVTQAAEGRLT